MAGTKKTFFSKSNLKSVRVNWTQVLLFLWGSLIIYSLLFEIPSNGNLVVNFFGPVWKNLILAAGIWLLTAALIKNWKKGEKNAAFLSAMVNSSPDAIVGFTLEGAINSWNKGAEAIFGYTAEEMLGRSFSKYVEAVVPERLQKESTDRFSLLEVENTVIRVETVRRHKDGHEINVSMELTPVFDAQGRVIGQGGIIRDITEQKKNEEAYRQQEAQLRLAQKMDAIGHLAGGVAHDFNNLLVVVRGNSEYLLEKFGEKGLGGSELVEIQDAAQRGSELTRQLLAFANKQVSAPKPLHLNEVASRMNNMLHRLIYDHIEMYLLQEKDLQWIQGDEAQVEQVLLNLVINARDAMPNGGHLLLETQNVEIGPSEKSAKLPAGNYVRLSVKDTGTGMSEEVQKHIFEPFFTTKGERGTGLGLATVYRIVQRMGGHILVQSMPGVGTEFAVYFPALAGPHAAAAAPRCVSLDTTGTETILVAEDDEPVRKIIVKTLRGKGYQVLEAANGMEALKAVGDHPQPIDLLLTDVMMPKMNGKDLAERMVMTHNSIKVLFMTGYSNGVLDGQDDIPSGMVLLQKPFSSALLTQRIREMLDEKTGSGSIGRD